MIVVYHYVMKIDAFLFFCKTCTGPVLIFSHLWIYLPVDNIELSFLVNTVFIKQFL
jgi:hypothetical protein